ncbi:hypothetical protein HCH54_008613 [Aspergillus fumigatus]
MPSLGFCPDDHRLQLTATVTQTKGHEYDRANTSSIRLFLNSDHAPKSGRENLLGCGSLCSILCALYSVESAVSVLGEDSPERIPSYRSAVSSVLMELDAREALRVEVDCLNILLFIGSVMEVFGHAAETDLGRPVTYITYK